MGRILTVASQKGGVGKTTTAVNLSASLSLGGRDVLLVDLDPQANASSGVGFSSGSDGGPEPEKGLLSQSLASRNLRALVKSTRFEGLSIIRSSPELSDLDVVRRVQGGGMGELRSRMRRLASEFDLVVVDCPPSLGGLPTIALGVSDSVLIPVQCEYYAMEGLSQILPIIKEVSKRQNGSLGILGLLLTMFSEELELSREVRQEIFGYFPDLVFDTVVPRDVVLAEAASHGIPAYHYSPTSRGAWSYLELAKEVMEDERT